MNYKMIGRLMAWIFALEALFMIPPMLICFADGDRIAAMSFVYSLLACLAASGILALLSLKAKRGFYAREGLVSVGVCWIGMSLLGCLPFYLSGTTTSCVSALFEIVSGFTTTGATILTDVEAVSRGILYWRSFSHWLGGMGVLVFLLALVPVSGRSDGFTMHILRAESPGPNVGKLVPRMRQTAMILYLLYIALTVADIIFLLAGKMPLFDALCTAFGTAGTGGFGVKNDSIASYSPYIQNVCTVFMFLFGVNFSCYYLLMLGKVRAVFRDEELRLYLGVAIASVLLITLNLRGVYPSFGETLRHAAFQVSSIMTTTGFATTDFDLWPSFSKGLLLCLMFVGACAGSTGGGIKCARIVLLLKNLRRSVRQVLHPNKVQAVRVNGCAVDEKILSDTGVYLFVYVLIVLVSYLLISLDGLSSTTNFSAVLACFNNIGPGLDLVGPTCSYAGFGTFSQLVLIGDMLAGRLEIFPILVLFSKSTWLRR